MLQGVCSRSGLYTATAALKAIPWNL